MSNEKPKALIVEDEAESANIFAIALRSAGYEPEVMSDGQAALTWLEHNTPKLVVLDLHLPRVSGDKILATIRADVRLRHAVVFVASADARLSDEMQELADKIIDKPASFRHLRDLAARYLEHVPDNVDDE